MFALLLYNIVFNWGPQESKRCWSYVHFVELKLTNLHPMLHVEDLVLHVRKDLKIELLHSGGHSSHAGIGGDTVRYRHP